MQSFVAQPIASRSRSPYCVVTAQHVARPRSRKEDGHRTAPRDRRAGMHRHDSTREKDPGFPHIPTSSSALPVVIGQRQRRTRRDEKASKTGNPTQPWFDQSQTRQKITCSSLFGKTEMGIPLMTPSQLCVWVHGDKGRGSSLCNLGMVATEFPGPRQRPPNDINGRWRQQGS